MLPRRALQSAFSALPPKRRKRRSAQLRNALRWGVLLSVLGGANVYVFFYKKNTAFSEVLKPVSTSRAIADEKEAVVKDGYMPLPASIAKAEMAKVAK